MLRNSKAKAMANKYLFHVDDRSVADSSDEHGIQVRLLNRMRMKAPQLRVLAIPNQGQRSAYGNMRMRAEGLTKGTWDLLAQGDGEIAWLELKTRTGQITPEQLDFGNWLVNNRFRCGVFRSVETAEQWLQSLWPHLFMSEAA